MNLKKKTLLLRRKVGLACLRVFTPKLVYDVENLIVYKANIRSVPRPFTLFLKRYFGNKALVGVEIGFGLGENARNLLSELNIKRLYCVDPYIFKPYVQNGKKINFYVNGKRNLYFELKRNSRVSFIRYPSDEAFELYGDNLFQNLDFVYVDGNHETDFVFRDIANSFKAVKINGVVGGHDFTTEFENTVVPAVFRFAVKVGLEPQIQVPDFWFTKNNSRF